MQNLHTEEYGEEYGSDGIANTDEGNDDIGGISNYAVSRKNGARTLCRINLAQLIVNQYLIIYH